MIIPLAPYPQRKVHTFYTEKKHGRSQQDSNLRGETPMDFESIALTARPQLQDFGVWFTHKR